MPRGLPTTTRRLMNRPPALKAWPKWFKLIHNYVYTDQDARGRDIGHSFQRTLRLNGGLPR